MCRPHCPPSVVLDPARSRATAKGDRRTDGGSTVSSQTITPTRIRRTLTASLAVALLSAAGGLAGAAPAAAAPLPPTPVTVTYTSVGETAFRVPAGVTSVHVVVIGGHGGQGFFGLGGSGAKVEGDLSVKPEDVLYAEVAADGGDLMPGYTPPGVGFGVITDGLGGTGGTGFGSGGTGSQGYWSDPIGAGVFFAGGGGGGGASAIVSCGVGDSACSQVPLVVAGGGGGGGYNTAGGDGGTPVGANGGGSGILIGSGTPPAFGGGGGPPGRARRGAAAHASHRFCP